MGLTQADQERLEAANVELGGAYDLWKAARLIVADRDETPLQRARAVGRMEAFQTVIAAVTGLTV
jgi:hypothetical protein